MTEQYTPPAPQGAPVPPPGQVQPEQKKGFAITALVIGIVAILGSWIPFLGLGSVFLGLIGLVFGVIAIVQAVKGTAGGKVMAIVGASLSALAMIIGVAATAAGVSAVDAAIEDLDEQLDEEFASSLDDSASETVTETEDVVDDAAVEEVTETEETESAADGEGTRSNPFPAGTVLTNDEVEITLGEANWAADDIVASENQFNDAAADGSTFVLLPVTVTNVASAEPVTPWLDVEVFFVSADGRSFEEAYEVIPDELSDISDLYEGGTGTGNIVFEIPTDVQEDGVWGVEFGWFSDATFVAAK